MSNIKENHRQNGIRISSDPIIMTAMWGVDWVIDSSNTKVNGQSGCAYICSLR